MESVDTMPGSWYEHRVTECLWDALQRLYLRIHGLIVRTIITGTVVRQTEVLTFVVTQAGVPNAQYCQNGRPGLSQAPLEWHIT